MKIKKSRHNWTAEDVALQEIAAILSHPCQQCAEDPNAWHTRSGFCEHRKGAELA